MKSSSLELLTLDLTYFHPPRAGRYTVCAFMFRSGHSQWGVGPPVQSRSFRVLQKMTDMDHPDGECTGSANRVSEVSKRSSQIFEQAKGSPWSRGHRIPEDRSQETSGAKPTTRAHRCGSSNSPKTTEHS